jgi:two-component system, NarL family, sensor kinase
VTGLRRHRDLAVFVAAGVVAMLAISLLLVWLIGHATRDAALRQAERTSTQVASSTVEPLLDAVLRGDSVQADNLSRAVRGLLQGGRVVAVVVWDADGRAVWADDPTVVGTMIPEPEQLADAARGVARTDVTDQPDTHRPGVTKVVEGFVPVRAGRDVHVLEINLDYAPVQAAIDELDAAILPAALGALVVLQLVQVPIAGSLQRRVRRHQAERATLLERALSASDGERRRIAADLHDGVVPDLATVALAADTLARQGDPAPRALAEHLARSTRATIAALRRVAADIAPPDLAAGGLSGAVDGLADPLRACGTDVSVEVGPLPPLDSDVTHALYRVAREALANVARHAQAREVRLRLGESGADEIVLEVSDDGIGPAGAAESGGCDGDHLGLRLLHERVTDLGGRLSVEPGTEGGTTLLATLPARTRT